MLTRFTDRKDEEGSVPNLIEKESEGSEVLSFKSSESDDEESEPIHIPQVTLEALDSPEKIKRATTVNIPEKKFARMDSLSNNLSGFSKNNGTRRISVTMGQISPKF